MLKLTKLEKQRAKEDIKVYVLCRDDKYDTPWEIKEEIEITKLKEIYGYFGFYSYRYLSELEKFIELLGGDKTNLTIKEAVIPKDSDYYEGVVNYSFIVSKEYVELGGFISNRIKIKE